MADLTGEFLRSAGSRNVSSLFPDFYFQRVEDVPEYVQQATPLFIGLILLELLLSVLKTGAPPVAVGDSIISLSAGMVSRLPMLLMRSCELGAYVYVWDHHRLMELPWDSAWTWWTCLLGVDFCYYWVHRFAHEVSFLWASHQVHHSSEYYNLTTALRQSLTQQFTSWMFYLPLALFIPPAIFAAHIQFNLLYQFWIHTELIRDLGPLEWIFNTPKHHRVHHGRNIYCIDKNYGGALIIWDRMFGTFALETDKVVYGLVFPLKKSDILNVQFHYYLGLWKKSRKFSSIGNKLLTFVNGPSWRPGKRRLGDHSSNPPITGTEVPHNPRLQLPAKCYVCVHFLLVVLVNHCLFDNSQVLTQWAVLGMISYVLLTLTTLGYIIDQRPAAGVLELLRCAAFMALQRSGVIESLMPPPAATLTEVFVFVSLLYWALQSLTQLITIRKKIN